MDICFQIRQDSEAMLPAGTEAVIYLYSRPITRSFFERLSALSVIDDSRNVVEKAEITMYDVIIPSGGSTFFPPSVPFVTQN